MVAEKVVALADAGIWSKNLISGKLSRSNIMSRVKTMVDVLGLHCISIGSVDRLIAKIMSCEKEAN